MDEKIEAVAKALCRLDGKDPEQSTGLAGGRVGFQAAVGESPAAGPAMWTLYKAEAERFVVAAEALAPILDRARRW